MSEAQDRIREILAPLVGREVPGGCDSCNAYQTNEEVSEGIWMLTVHHDDDCPELARHRHAAPRY